MEINRPLKQVDLKSKLTLYFFRFIVYLVLILFAATIIFIFYTLVINTTRAHVQIQRGLSLFPGKSFVRNFKALFGDTNMFVARGILNSLFIATCSAVLTTYFSALSAYSLHLYRFKGRTFAYMFILAIIMIPSQIASIGLVTILYRVNFVDNYWVIILPAIASPTTVFFMKQYLDSNLPYEVIEAARVDGSHEFRTFNQIVLPILSPAMAVQFIFAFVASWNNLFFPSLIIQSSNKRTVPVIISLLSASSPDTFDTGKNFMLMAWAIVPMIIVYLIFSKRIIKGITAGSVKG
jgi:multiple sugar transport system permease protein